MYLGSNLINDKKQNDVIKMAAGIVVAGGLVLLSVILALKTKNENLERQNRVLTSQNNDLSNENRILNNTITKLKEELEKLKKS